MEERSCSCLPGHFSPTSISPSNDLKKYIYILYSFSAQVADEFNYESDKDIYKELFKEDMKHRGGSVR